MFTFYMSVLSAANQYPVIIFLKVGTSSVVYPAAAFAPMLAARGVPVAEFNLEETPCTGEFR